MALGRQLFFSRIISDDGRVACSSCHLPGHAFAEPRRTSLAPGRPETQLNTPTLLDVVYLDRLNWAGRFDSLEEHLDALIQNPVIVGTTWPALAARLAADPEWSARFRSTLGRPPTAEDARAALLAYERSLTSGDAPFDRFARGDATAISEAAKTGYWLFKSRGCASCHQGALVGGNLFQRLGVFRPYYSGATQVRPADLGRHALTGREEDRHVFRVPSLRNVAVTAPYLHDGSEPTLPGVVSLMATYQLGRTLAADEVSAIVEFLKALSGSSPELGP